MNLIKGIRRWTMRRWYRKLSVADILVFFLKGLLRIVTVGILLFAGYALAVQDLSGLTELSPRQWFVLIGASVLVVGINYLIELIAVSRKRKDLEREETSYRLITGSIQEFIYNRKQLGIATLLTNIEKVVRLTLEVDEQRVHVSANWMRYEPETLTIKVFGSFLEGREYRSFEVDEESPAPGACSAFVAEKIIYIADTQDPIYGGHFEPGKSYRSIVSIPVFGTNREILGVVNIDSTEADFFRSTEFIDKYLWAKISPFVYLIAVEVERSEQAST